MASSTELAQSTPLVAEGSVTSDPATASRFVPYHSAHHQPAKGRYITSNDPRGYIPVYEYPLNGQWIMMDMDDGYILWTGIWKALGNHKADIVKMLESQPELATQLRRVRGGYLKIQGTWLAYEVALRLARRVGWPIRHDLVPLFGPTFPTTCLAPDQPGYGTVIAPTGRRKPRRSLQSVGIPPPHGTPYPPKLPLAKDLSYNPGHYIEGTVQEPHLEAGHLRRPPFSSSPVNPHAMSFAPPAIPAVPPLAPMNGVAYSVPESPGASQYTTNGVTYSSMREYPSNVRYSPYALPTSRHSPPSSYIVPGSLSYDQQQHIRPLVHRASDPNLRSLHSRGHLLPPRLSLNTHQLPTARETKRPFLPRSSAPEAVEMGGDESRRLAMTEELTGEGYGASSGDSTRSSIPTPPFSEMGGPAYDHGWPVVQNPIDGGAQWPETPGDLPTTYDGAHYFTDSAASYSDPSSISPRTAWSYDGYSRHSPSERHYQYNTPRSVHHHYSSISSTNSFGERRVSMADSIASSFPEPEMPLPQMSYHRYSQPHLHNPIPPQHSELWMKEPSGSFAEASYSLQQAQQERSNQDMTESQSMAPSQKYTSSPPLAHNPGHLRASSNGSMNRQLSHYSPHQEAQAGANW